MLVSVLAMASRAASAADGVLVDQFGRAVPAQALRGQVLLVYFGFSHCAELCPSALLTMSRALADLGSRGDEVLPLFVSIDPGHDSAGALRAYLAHFDARIRGLTGTPAAIADAAASFDVQFKPAAAAGGVPQFHHSVFIYVADRHGRVVRRFLPGSAAQDVAAALRACLAEPVSP